MYDTDAKRTTIAFGIAVVLFLLILVTIAGVYTARGDVRSRASSESTALLLPTVIPAPKTPVTPPYLRLVGPSAQVSVGDLVPISVYLHSGEQGIVETRISVLYDGTSLSLEDKNIQSTDGFPVVSVEHNAPGKVLFSLFVTEEAGYEPVTTTKEEKIATVYFRVIGGSGTRSDLSFIEEIGEETTSLFPPRSGEQLPTSILSSVEGTSIRIK